MLAWLGANWMQLAVGVLVLDRALERIFPNAAVLKKIDAVLAQAGIKAE